MKYFFFKSLRFLAILLIATGAGAQTASYDPYNQGSEIPQLMVTWQSRCQDTNAVPTYVSSDSDVDYICNKITEARPENLLCGPVAESMEEALVAGCKQNFKDVRKQLKSQCDYIVASRIGLNFTFIAGGCPMFDTKCWADRFYYADSAHTIPAPIGAGAGEVGCGQVPNPYICVKPLWGVKFQVKTEANCRVHDNKNKCEQCYEDRHLSQNNQSNKKRDEIDNTDKDDAEKEGGYIHSQGCVIEASKNSLGSIGQGGINLSSIYNFGATAGAINIMVPKCMLNPMPPDADFIKFENYNDTSKPQKQEVYDVIDKTYQDIIDSKKNPYKGNCGRGKFFYSKASGKSPHDANVVTSQVSPDSSATIVTNDIWESRTGCYNPEERFVILPTGKVTGKIEYHDASQENLDPKKNPAAIAAFDYQKALKGMNPLADFLEPWDTVKSGMDTSSTSNYLVPDDRMLMRNPICVKDYNAAMSSDALKRKVKAIDNIAKVGEGNENIYVNGSLPICMTDDYLDEREGYCAHYYQRMHRPLFDGPSGLPQIPLEAADNFANDRYVFKTTDFCWKKEKTTPFLTPLRDNHWMPLAIRGEMPAGTTTTTDIYGNTHTYHKSDYKRPTFTTYSQRNIKDKYDGVNPLEHEFTSNEEYGYRDEMIERNDYAFKRENIYNPDATGADEKIKTEDLLKPENLGRKSEMQQCIGLYLEQWAFEGDKGAIMLDSEAQLLTDTIGAVTPDSSMCQWVAYYDTSENYGEEDFLKQRNLFKITMYNFFSKVQDKNSSNSDVNIKPLLNPSTTNLLDPQRYQPKNGNDGIMGLSTQGISDAGLAGVDKAFFPDNMNKDSNGFRRRSGMRPEIFDYYNFLSFGAIGAYPEGYDLTNGTKVGDGNAYGEDYEDLAAVNSSLGSNSSTNGSGNAVTEGLKNDLYSVTVNDKGFSNLDLSKKLGWQVNMERRNCRSVVPPQFWRDVIKPFQGCDFNQGSRMINDLDFSLKQRNSSGINSLMTSVLSPVISGITGALSSDSKHWMTTDVNKNITSLLTVYPGLPVFAYGIDMENGLYIKNNIEKFEVGAGAFGQSTSTDKSPLYIQDTWLSRAGGKAVMKTHIIEKKWKSDRWAGNEDPEEKPTQDDTDDKIDVSKGTTTGYKQYDLGSDPWYDYDRYKEDPKIVDDQQRIGMIMLDEKKFQNGKFSGREWVDASWPGRTCMHMEPLSISLGSNSLPSGGGTDIASVISSIAGLIDVNTKVTEGAIKDANGNDLPLLTSPSGKRKYYSIDMNVGNNLSMVVDSWRMQDDIFVGRIPVFQKDNSGRDSPDIDDKQMGGFKVFQNIENYFEWLPSSWTVSVGINKAFWCEFESPYNPYFSGDAEFNFNKTQPTSNWSINAQKNIFQPLSSGDKLALAPEKKPRLEYYRVERIRDSCGPFGARSTWMDDPNGRLGEWLVGEKFGDVTGQDPTITRSRCADWLDLYKKGIKDPKIIAWRLPRFDYEFLKSFLDCTGPIRAEGPSPCELNSPQHELNNSAAVCERAKAVINYLIGCNDGYWCGNDNNEGSTIECRLNSGSSGGFNDTIQPLVDNLKKICGAGNANRGCYKKVTGNSASDDQDSNKWKPLDKMIDNSIRGGDLETRGDTFYGLDMPYKNNAGDVVNDRKVLYALDGFRELTTQHKHSTQIEKFWLKKPGISGDMYAEDEPFGFWCTCPSDNYTTTRCREDFCTVEQHVLLLGRSDPFGFGTGSSALAIAKAPGPYGRWLQCFYQARSKACPILTREVSDTPAYSTITDPFQQDSKATMGLEFTAKNGQNFNVCTPSNSSGNNDPHGFKQEQMAQFMRWSREEPNHLARLPVWFESSGNGYRHQDLMFYTQVRDYEAPYMEMAVPFPIDLITRSGEDPAQANCGDEYKETVSSITNPLSTNKPCDKRRINALGEINQREGTYKIDYLNMAFNDTKKVETVKNPNDEKEAMEKYQQGFRSKLLAKYDASKIEPTLDGNKYKDSKAYTSLYTKYLKGLYATSVSYSQTDAALPPTQLGRDVSSDITAAEQNSNSTFKINPRSQEIIVGPRGCDIGGWYEMMLYQARCIKWFRLNCICDYDKTFARGNAINFALRRAGATMKVAYPQLVDPKYKITTSEYMKSEEGQKKDNKGETVVEITDSSSINPLGTPKPALNTTVSKVEFDVYGNPQALKANGIRAAYDRKVWPLVDRGNIGPEFAVKSAKDYNIKGDINGTDGGLDKVRIGDIIYWDETIKYKNDNGGAEIDAGYPRHAAYVKGVARDDSLTSKQIKFIDVEEMNWGKNLDSCGNTDMWGRQTIRRIYNPDYSNKTAIANTGPQAASINTASDDSRQTITKMIDGPILTKPPLESFAPCRNADWAVCVEQFWKQVNIYRPYTVDNDGNAVQDPEYANSDCKPSNDASSKFPKLLTKTRIEEIAKAEGIPDDVIAKGTDAIRYYIFEQNTAVDSDGNPAPAAGYSNEEIMYKSEKWKLLASPTEGAYPVDEVEKFLSNPLNGTVDRCDPPADMRDNFKAVKQDAKTAGSN